MATTNTAERRQALEAAAAYVEEMGASIREVAAMFSGVSKSALHAEMQRRRSGEQRPNRRGLLSDDEEKLLVRWIQDRVYAHAPVFRELAIEKMKEIVTKRTNQRPSGSGARWYRGFRARNPMVVLRVAESLDADRRAAESESPIKSFFTLLSELFAKHAYPATHIWNMDETGILFDLTQRKAKVLAIKGMRGISQGSWGTRDHLTVVSCGSAFGSYIPNTYIFKGVLGQWTYCVCFQGYYDGSVFHRVVKDFMVQGGDPTGSGFGGESASGTPFADEIHTRLRFNHRGLFAMANTGPNTNASQFFITTGPCEWLAGKHTIFGKITGDTIYNVLKINELEVDDSERPLYPPRILGTDVLFNPFDDIEPRPKKPKSSSLASVPASAPSKLAQKRRPTPKNKALLSFDEEEDEASGEAPVALEAGQRKIRSSHDLLSDPTLSKEPAPPPVESQHPPAPARHAMKKRRPSEASGEGSAANKKPRRHVTRLEFKAKAPTVVQTDTSLERPSSEAAARRPRPGATKPGRDTQPSDAPANRPRVIPAHGRSSDPKKALKALETFRATVATASSSNSWLSHRLEFPTADRAEETAPNDK